MKQRFIKLKPIRTDFTLRIFMEISLLKYIANSLYIVNDFQTPFRILNY